MILQVILQHISIDMIYFYLGEISDIVHYDTEVDDNNSDEFHECENGGFVDSLIND